MFNLKHSRFLPLLRARWARWILGGSLHYTMVILYWLSHQTDWFSLDGNSVSSNPKTTQSQTLGY